MGWDGRERRKQKRYGLKDSLVQYKRSGVLSFLQTLSPRYLLLNFSKGGCHFISRENLEPGTLLNLRLEVPGKGVFSARGSVAWARKSDRLDAYRTGIRFSHVSDRSRMVLQKLLDSALLENVDISTKVYLKEIDRL